MRAHFLPAARRRKESDGAADRNTHAPVRTLQTRNVVMTKYILCKNLECCCPLEDGQEFCDNCNSPSPLFLRQIPSNREGSLIGHAEDGEEYHLPLSFPSYAFYGITGSRKTTLSRKLAVDAENSGISILVLDPEGEWKHIIPKLNRKTEYFATSLNLKINPFDLKDKQLIRILLKETVLKGIQTDSGTSLPR